ncbi:protein-glutamate methylesterase/protein-glutamine glutaminase [Marinobacterium stanieri]|uniref:Protein-glutamate methylesterase/protein-glutamine glutaminase n=1 Tax=Marinobacterium stanieri TaxID=49186 RepID=A0A1N6WMS1_9GAMM|nr:chemotaxis response regulator protein-glutamate methylesterase [Marinobacterium stanieri]SIQ91322.1 two-component system, chemotaxis family, response regulator CheB [Marinobacterium stanieri]
MPTNANRPVRVLIVDDSLVVRDVISELLGQQSTIEVVGTAADPYEARQQIKALQPDVITLDIEMPRMDGVTFLRNLMRLHPMPVIMLSSLTHEGADITLEALEAGAVDFIAKPGADSSDSSLEHFAQVLQQKVMTAAGLGQRLTARARQRPSTAPQTQAKTTGRPAFDFSRNLIAIGASTGGTEALRDLLQALPPELPPIIVTQHIPGGFSARFARRLNSNCRLTVKEAEQGEKLLPGQVYITPGGLHLQPVRIGGELRVQLDDSEPVNRHKPSVEVMFNGLLRLDTTNSVLVMLTGMGEDGADAMTTGHRAGLLTLVQDQASSLVWGMPGAVVKRGGASQTLALDQIPSALLKHCYAGSSL